MPQAEDARLRGRTYAIPFDRVWTQALALAAGKLRGWSVVSADDVEGEIRAETRGLLGGASDVVIRIGLDRDAQTRVDVTSASRNGRVDFGANARRIVRLLRALDRALAPTRR